MHALYAFLAASLFVATGLAGCRSSAQKPTPDLSLPAADGGTEDLLKGPDDLLMSPGDLALPSLNAAPVWTSCGGGLGVGDVTGSELNFTVGDVSVVGVSSATSGASVTFSYFSDDNH